ncbi:DNA polymerase III subunit beta [Alicyclobacillus fodiniaquatilis]|uniref:Beta sliding clamp n=1 Tax=Alicyclobacillus fodiniaquatilis TaxID=1661150 RepID=A0ABW4JRL9_9BACL
MVTAYDLEVGIVNRLRSADDVNIDVAQEGSALLPAKKLIDIIRKLVSSAIDIEVAPDNTGTIRSGEFECTLFGIETDLFPQLPMVSGIPDVRIPANLLSDCIRSTAFAASKSESRPILTGVHVHLDRDEASFSATDSLRLATKNIRLETGLTSLVNVIVPAKSLIELERILPDLKDEVSLTVTSSHCLFTAGSLRFYTRIIEGTFVEIDRLIPKKIHITQIVVNTRQIVSAIDRAMVIAPRNHEIQFEISKEKAYIKTKSPEYGNLTDVIPTKSIDGDLMVIALYAKNALEALQTFKSEEAIVRFTGANQPIVFLPNDDPTLCQVMNLQWYSDKCATELESRLPCRFQRLMSLSSLIVHNGRHRIRSHTCGILRWGARS